MLGGARAASALAAALAAATVVASTAHAGGGGAVPAPLGAAADRCDHADDETRITAAFVGDVLMHDTLQIQAHRHAAGGGFETTWHRVAPTLAAADVAYANLEGPVAENLRCDGRFADAAPEITVANSRCGPNTASSVYTSSPRHNYHPLLLDALAGSGFDVVSTANNHALDRFAVGADMTIDALSTRGIAFTGTRRAGSASAFHTITPVRGAGGTINVAWLGCTYGTNGLPDVAGQVLYCNAADGTGPHGAVISMVETLSARRDVDAVIVTPHWGAENRQAPTDRQRRLARAFVEAGATAVIGTHPHVMGPAELVEAGGRQGFVAYSLGNFIADQPAPETRASLVLLLSLSKQAGAPARVDGAGFWPLFVAHGVGGLSRTLAPLDPGTKPPAEAVAALASILSVLPEHLRLSSADVAAILDRACDGGDTRSLVRPTPGEATHERV